PEGRMRAATRSGAVVPPARPSRFASRPSSGASRHLVWGVFCQVVFRWSFVSHKSATVDLAPAKGPLARSVWSARRTGGLPLDRFGAFFAEPIGCQGRAAPLCGLPLTPDWLRKLLQRSGPMAVSV